MESYFIDRLFLEAQFKPHSETDWRDQPKDCRSVFALTRNNRSIETAHYETEKCSLSNLRTEPPWIRCGHEEIASKVLPIKVSIKMISFGSMSFYPLGESNLRVLQLLFCCLLGREKYKKEERWKTVRRKGRLFEEKRGFTLEGLWSRSKLIGRLYRSRLLRCIAFRNKASIKRRVCSSDNPLHKDARIRIFMKNSLSLSLV